MIQEVLRNVLDLFERIPPYEQQQILSYLVDHMVIDGIIVTPALNGKCYKESKKESQILAVNPSIGEGVGLSEPCCSVVSR